MLLFSAAAADDDGANDTNSGGKGDTGEANGGDEGKFKEGPASTAQVSLSQAILGPLDAIFKAQVHAARSFLNLVQQLGYPHVEGDDGNESTPSTTPDNNAGGAGGTTGGGGAPPDPGKSAYTVDFLNEVEIDGKRQLQKISVPALALVPIAPLAVESSTYTFDLHVRYVGRHKQLRKSTNVSEESRKNRPWMLVDEPISVRGNFAPSEENGGGETSRQSRVKVEINVGRVPQPAALDKLLTSLSQITTVENLPPEGGSPSSPAEPPSPESPGPESSGSEPADTEPVDTEPEDAEAPEDEAASSSEEPAAEEEPSGEEPSEDEDSSGEEASGEDKSSPGGSAS
jgi:hypothetical protein